MSQYCKCANPTCCYIVDLHGTSVTHHGLSTRNDQFCSTMSEKKISQKTFTCILAFQVKNMAGIQREHNVDHIIHKYSCQCWRFCMYVLLAMQIVASWSKKLDITENIYFSHWNVYFCIQVYHSFQCHKLQGCSLLVNEDTWEIFHPLCLEQGWLGLGMIGR